jgi:hypothetical protein
MGEVGIELALGDLSVDLKFLLRVFDLLELLLRHCLGSFVTDHGRSILGLGFRHLSQIFAPLS